MKTSLEAPNNLRCTRVYQELRQGADWLCRGFWQEHFWGNTFWYNSCLKMVEMHISYTRKCATCVLYVWYMCHMCIVCVIHVLHVYCMCDKCVLYVWYMCYTCVMYYTCNSYTVIHVIHSSSLTHWKKWYPSLFSNFKMTPFFVAKHWLFSSRQLLFRDKTLAFLSKMNPLFLDKTMTFQPKWTPVSQ